MLKLRAWLFSRESCCGHTWKVADLRPAVLSHEYLKLLPLKLLPVLNMTEASVISAAEAGRVEMESMGLSCAWSEAQATPAGEARQAELFRDRHLRQGAGPDRNDF